jgi:hypothetical protein
VLLMAGKCRFVIGHEPCPSQTNVSNLLLATGKIDQETVNNMRSWTYSGFSVDNSVYLAPCGTFGREPRIWNSARRSNR